MIVRSYRPRMGFWDMVLAAFIGTVAGTLTARLVDDYLLSLLLG